MTLVVEDGTGRADANVYGTRVEANEYFTLRGNGEWSSFPDADKDARLIIATDYIDTRWGPSIKGDPINEDQALKFPRDLWDGLPLKVKYACFEYAYRAIKETNSFTLTPDPSFQDGGVRVVTTEETIGPLTRKFYPINGNATRSYNFRPYPYPDRLMGEFLQIGEYTYR